MFLLWLIGLIITVGLMVAYIRSKAKQKNVPEDKQNLFTEIQWNNGNGEAAFVVVICGLFCLLWPITIPMWWVYLIGKKIFK